MWCWTQKASVATFFQPPPPEISVIVDRTTRLVAQKGLEFEERLMSTYVNNAKFSFLRSSDPFHSFYKHTVTKYLAPKLPFTRTRSCYIGYSYPSRISLKELGIIKFTAQFAAWYGRLFRLALMKRMDKNPLFDFLKQNDTRSRFYAGIASAYHQVLRDTDDCMETVLWNFFHRLQLEKLEEGVEMALIDLHAFTSGVDCFAYIEDDYFPISMPPAAPLSLMLDGRGMLDGCGMLVRTEYHGAQKIHPDAQATHESVGDAKPALDLPFLGVGLQYHFPLNGSHSRSLVLSNSQRCLWRGMGWICSRMRLRL